MNRRLGAGLLAVSLLSGTAAVATDTQTATPPQSAPASAPVVHRVNGTIVSFDGRTLTVKADTGEVSAAGVLATTVVLYNEPRHMSDIHAGDFIGSAALLGSDGKLHAQEVRIFPESLRGMGEGQYPMGDNNPNRSMTNATVQIVTSVSEQAGSMTLTYHGEGPANAPLCTGHAATGGQGCVGQTEIEVAPGVPIMAYVVGDTTALVAGAAVSARFIPGDNGAWSVSRLVVEHNGIKPL
jgi:hypothetical protein